MMIAEELDVEWSAVRVEQAELESRLVRRPGRGRQRRHDRRMARSASVPARSRGCCSSPPPRNQWHVDPASCETSRGVVHHRASGRAGRAWRSRGGRRGAAGAEGGAAAEGREPPHDCRPPPTRGVDTPKIVVGAPIYGLDARVPGMLHAVIEKCPVHGGRPARVDAVAALAVPGVTQVVTIDGHKNPTWLKPGVAVVADSTWAAMKGREALRVTWDEGDGR